MIPLGLHVPRILFNSVSIIEDEIPKHVKQQMDLSSSMEWKEKVKSNWLKSAGNTPVRRQSVATCDSVNRHRSLSPKKER